MEGQHIICVRLDGGYSSEIKCHRANDPRSVPASVTKPHSAPLRGHAFGVCSQDRLPDRFHTLPAGSLAVPNSYLVVANLNAVFTTTCSIHCLHVKTAGFSELRDCSDFRLEEQ